MAASRVNNPLRPSIRLSPVHSRTNSHSTSPERNPGSLYQKLDPLLSNLSPESTLHALTSTEAVPTNEKRAHDILSQSINQVSQSERALGIRAALAAQNLELWYKEVQSWTWPKQNDAKVGKGFCPPSESHSRVNNPTLLPDDTETEYYGSLPATVVEHHEKRIEEIRDGMDDLNVEELKEHVLNAHIPSRSRPSSSTSSVSVPPPLSYVQLSDFTAVVTATILRALPFLSRLNNLLSTWDVRLLVLRQIPGLLRELKLTRSSLNSSLNELRSPNQAHFTSSSLRAEHVKHESAVVGVGRRMDRILDALEGRQDSLPESWIDELEAIESEFAAWVVEAERYTVRNEFFRSTDDPDPTSATPVVSEPTVDDCTHQPRQDESGATVSDPEEQGERPSQMVTIEKPACDSTTTAENKHLEPTEVPVQNDSTVCPKESTNSVPECPSVHPDSQSALQQPSISTDDEGEDENHKPVVIAGDKTPTQIDFVPQFPAEAFEQPSPSPEPPSCPLLPDNENILPTDKQEERAPSPRTSPAKPAVLSEHSDLVEDSSMQDPTPADEIEVKEGPNVDISVGAKSEAAIESSSDRNLQSETVLDTEQETVDGAESLKTPPAPGQSLREEAELTVELESAASSVVIAEPQSQPPPDTSNETGIPVPILNTVEVSNDIPGAREPVLNTPPRPLSQRAVLEDSAGFESKLASPDSGPVIDTNLAHPGSSRQPLQSPIKLSKTRPGKLNLNKDTKKSRRRGDSTGSVASLLSDTSSFISSPDAPEPHTGSPKDALLVQPSSHREYTHRSRVGPPPSDHTLREDRLLRLEDQKNSLRPTFYQNRAVSLPLERFINERLSLNLDDESACDAADPTASAVSGGVEKRMPIHDISSTPTPQVPRASDHRPMTSRGKPSSERGPKNLSSRFSEHNRNGFTKNSHQTTEHQRHLKPHRLRKRLTNHPSLESLGVKRQQLSHVEEDEAELADVGSRAPSPSWHSRKPRDQLDRKINSILNTLPGRIHLLDANHDTETSSSSSSLDRRMRRDRRRSEPPHGPASRSITPAPSLTLMPAARKRHSHSHKLEDNCVKVYHLHHGGQSAPTKLFVRTVGEDGQRVMVRVGGGWADLQEYLREYVIHHGRRKVSETPRIEVQGLASHASPSYSSPGSMLTPAAPSYITSGRATPSRPPSVLSARPSSSLTVRKTRRGSNASDAVAPRAVTTGNLSTFTSPQTTATSTRRRLSVSSSYSEAHSPSHTVSFSTPHETHSKPLGLAGPKPRSRQISMSPEGEAWVEDVLQQTRRSGSLNPPPFTLSTSSSHDRDGAERHDNVDGNVTAHSLPRVRSIGDIGTAGTSRRVTLRGIGRRS